MVGAASALPEITVLSAEAVRGDGFTSKCRESNVLEILRARVDGCLDVPLFS
jgi:hypothetical protein